MRANFKLCICFFCFIFIFGMISDVKFWRYQKGIDVYNEYWTAELGEKRETDYNTSFFLKRKFIDLNGAIRRISFQHEMNEVVKLENGYITMMLPQRDLELLKTEAENISRLSGALKDRDIEFVLVLAPDKVVAYDKQLPIGIYDYSNENTDTFISFLSDDVSYIDLREEIIIDGMNQYEMFYRTDHHWNEKGGFYAYKKIAEWFDQNTDMIFDPKVGDLNNYVIEEYNGVGLGSWGQRTGRYFTEPDDFRLYIPKYRTEFTDVTLGNEGDFTSIFYDKGKLDVDEPSFIYDAVYCGGLSEIINHENATSNQTLLIITDSFGRVVEPYLSVSFDHTFNMTSYYSLGLTGAYLDQIKPDAVIMLISPWNNLGHDLFGKFGILEEK